MAKKKSDTNTKVRSLCSILSQRIEEFIGDEEQFNRYLIKEGKDGVTTESTFQKADTKSVKEMAQALKALSECSAILDGDSSSDSPAKSLRKITVKLEGLEDFTD